MTGQIITAEQMAMIRRLPPEISTGAAAVFLMIDPDEIDKYRPKRKRTSNDDDSPIPGNDHAHREDMRRASEAFMERFRMFHPERFA